MNLHPLILECNEMLKQQGLDYAFCGGHALDIYLGHTSRPHGDIDLSAWREDRNDIITFMLSQGWLVYEAMGDGKVHLITNTDDQKLVRLNIFCVREGCSFFHVDPLENGIFLCEIDHVEQSHLDYIEFLFNKRDSSSFIYSRNHAIRLPLDKAIHHHGELAFFAPELVLLYKSTDLGRLVNEEDYKAVLPHLAFESREWLRNALVTAFPDGHKWIRHLEKENGALAK